MNTSHADERAIEQLFLDYCEYIDSGAIESWVDCYTADGVFHGLHGEFRGRDALLAYGRRTLERGFFLHYLTNVRVRLDTDDPFRATADSYLLYVHQPATGSAEMVAARQHDVLRKADGRWRIAHRRLTAQPLRLA